MRKRTPPEERFWAKVNKHGPVPPRRPDLGPCWLWTASRAGGQPGNRYGWFWDGTHKTYAHRFAIQMVYGPIPDGLEPDHLCRTHICVKAVPDEHGPAHVIGPMTHAENMLGTYRTHCPKGHPYAGENLVVWGGQRYCRECNRLKKSIQNRQRIRRVRPERPEVGPANTTKTHCPAGHPYSGPNLRIDTNGARRCRACESEQNRKRPRRHR